MCKKISERSKLTLITTPKSSLAWLLLNVPQTVRVLKLSYFIYLRKAHITPIFIFPFSPFLFPALVKPLRYLYFWPHRQHTVWMILSVQDMFCLNSYPKYSYWIFCLLSCQNFIDFMNALKYIRYCVASVMSISKFVFRSSLWPMSVWLLYMARKYRSKTLKWHKTQWHKPQGIII